MRRWAKRVGLGLCCIVLAAGGFAAVNRQRLRAEFAAYQLRTATTPDDRATAAVALAALGDVGLPLLVDCLRHGDALTCAAVGDALRGQLANRSPADPAFAAIAAELREPAATYPPAGLDAVLGLVPDLLRCSDPAVVAACRELVRSGFAAASADLRVRSIRLALRPEVRLDADVVPLLDDPDPAVRSAALLALGPPGERPEVVSDEELFRWLNDVDAGVRKLCESALIARGRSADEVAFGRKLTHPDPQQRLNLLLDLRWADDAVKDVGPWLERLGRDPDPAVRAGAARVAIECRVPFAAWVDELAATDPDPLVRRVAEYYRRLTGELQPAGFDGP